MQKKKKNVDYEFLRLLENELNHFYVKNKGDGYKTNYLKYNMKNADNAP